MKVLLRIALLLIACAAAAVIISRLRARETAAPAAGLPGRPVPEPAPAPPATVDADDLAIVSGIGPVFRSRLAEAGITTFARLAAADPPAVVGATGVTPRRAADWIAQAVALAGR